MSGWANCGICAWTLSRPLSRVGACVAVDRVAEAPLAPRQQRLQAVPQLIRLIRLLRYAQGGGPTAERRRFRERIRHEAGERFARGERTAVIAKDLRVSERSVERWRRA
uniref:helix-turn-helix domain-containing protein n=1 Tax=Streptomyces alanosinicus TaxID=68171 RepID=UPI003570AC2B